MLHNRPFVVLNVATLLLYTGLAIMFFLVSFDLIDRRHLAPTDAGAAFLPFTLGLGFLSRPFGALADKIGARRMLIAGPCGAAATYVWLALGKNAPLVTGGVGADGTARRLFRCVGRAADGGGDVERNGRRRGTGLRRQQCGEPHRATCRHCARGLPGFLCGGLPRQHDRGGGAVGSGGRP